MRRASQVSSFVAALAALLLTSVPPAAAVDLGPAPGACPTPYVGPYPARHDFCVRTSEYGTLSVTPGEVGDGGEFTLTLSTSLPRCVGNTVFPCAEFTDWGAGDAVGSGPSYRLIREDLTYFRVISGKNYYYVPFDTATVATNPPACNASSLSYATECTYRVQFNNPANGLVPTAWVVWNMHLDVRTSATTRATAWLEAASIVVGNATNQAPTAAFTWEVRDDDPLTVDFDASTSRDDKGITKYEWSFGDGTTGTGPTPTHTFPEVGTYQVRLTVTDTQNATDSITWPVAPTPDLEVTLDGAQVPLGDLLELEMRVTNNGMVAMNDLEFPNPPTGLRVLDSVDPGQRKGELLLDVGPAPPLPTTLAPGETKSIRYLMYPSAVGQLWLTTEVTAVDADGGEHTALAAGVVTITDFLATLDELEDVAYHAFERVLEEGRDAGNAVQAALLDRFMFWVSHWGDPNNPPPPPTDFQRQMAGLVPGLSAAQREEFARFIPADPKEALAMVIATQEGLWEADKRVAREIGDLGQAAWKFGTGGPRVWKATATELVSAARNGKAALDGAITSGMTPLFTYASASEEDRARMRADVATAVDQFPARARQIANEKTQQGIQALNHLAQTYKNDKVGFVRKASEEMNYWNAQGAIAVVTGGAGSGLTAAATKSPKLLALLKVVGGGNHIKGAERAQSALDLVDLLSPITQIGTETTVPLLEEEFPDGITQYEADAFIEVATAEEQRLRGLGYDVEIGIGAAQASPESARVYQQALEARRLDPNVKLPPPKGVYRPKLPANYADLPADRQAELLARAEVKQAEYDAYLDFKSGNAMTKAGQVLAKAGGPDGGTFEPGSSPTSTS